MLLVRYGGYCRSHHVALPLLLLHHRDLTNWGHAHHHRLHTGQIREKEECGERQGAHWRKGLPIRHASISEEVNNRQNERGLRQADEPAPSGFTYLLLDVAVGHRNGARGSVNKVLVGGHLTRLHRCPSAAQLLHGKRKEKQQ